jgi:hypothetical protein
MTKPETRRARPSAVPSTARYDLEPTHRPLPSPRSEGEPAQLALFEVDGLPSAGGDDLAVKLMVDGRVTVIDGMHRLSAFLDLAARAEQETV